MNKFLHGLIQGGLIALQGVNAAAPFLPPPYNIAVAAGIGLIQGAVGLANHKSAPPAPPAGNVPTLVVPGVK